MPAVHPIRGAAGTARGADTVRSNERLDLNARSMEPVTQMRVRAGRTIGRGRPRSN